MSDQKPQQPTDGDAGGKDADRPGTTGPARDASTETSTERQTERSTGQDPLRGSRASGAWVFVVVLVVLLVLLAVFVLQNTQTVEVTFLGWTGGAPLAAALLIATAAGLLIAVAAGSLRILQLRRRVRKETKRSAKP